MSLKQSQDFCIYSARVEIMSFYVRFFSVLVILLLAKGVSAQTVKVVRVKGNQAIVNIFSQTTLIHLLNPTWKPNV